MKPGEIVPSGLHNEQTVLCYAMRGAHKGFLQKYEKNLRTVLDVPELDTMGIWIPSPHRLKSAGVFSEKYHEG